MGSVVAVTDKKDGYEADTDLIASGNVANIRQKMVELEGSFTGPATSNKEALSLYRVAVLAAAIPGEDLNRVVTDVIENRLWRGRAFTAVRSLDVAPATELYALEALREAHGSVEQGVLTPHNYALVTAQIGGAKKALGQYDEAIACFVEARSIFRGLNEHDEAAAFGRQEGFAYQDKKDFPAAIRTLAGAYEDALQCPETSPWDANWVRYSGIISALVNAQITHARQEPREANYETRLREGVALVDGLETTLREKVASSLVEETTASPGRGLAGYLLNHVSLLLADQVETANPHEARILRERVYGRAAIAFNMDERDGRGDFNTGLAQLAMSRAAAGLGNFIDARTALGRAEGLLAESSARAEVKEGMGLAQEAIGKLEARMA